ncbi:hypothetical protein CFD26_106566 [Aspergillus turcosus]|uniref:Deoxyribonuclease NucA/NucB domain-containing protein n=1 Tax=Aspergillus turcosus TaxID=1245748 RepID=A0A421D4D3_9EURO|nr:hypothetical protein CFD26_106566 [Aspergillus turcosus]
MRALKGLALLLAAASIAAATSWTPVRTGGGGGFVPGIVFHPNTQGVAYIRTDIGGMYRLNSDDSWTFISDSLVAENEHNMGTDAIALDPQNSNVIYAALGLYTNSWDTSNGAIVKSTDRGNSWTYSNLTFKVGGNMPGRGPGERLAVDPHNSNIIYFGARSGHGLWKSTDGGATFSNVTSFTHTGTYNPMPGHEYGDNIGLLFVTFDSTSSTINGATSRIFVGVADNITASVYESTDAGSTWSAVAGQPGTYFPHKCKLQPSEKALYLSYSDGVGPYDGRSGAVWRYDLTGNTWKDITPPVGWNSSRYFGFGGLALDMQKPGTLMVASLNSWWPSAQFYRSNDSGVSWTHIWEWGSPYYPNKNRYYSLSSPKAPWIETAYWEGWNYAVSSNALGWMIEALEIDPFDSNHWLYGTGMTVMGGHDLTKWDTIHNVSIQTMGAGIEEMAVQDIVSVPGGTELLLAVGDDSGFTYLTTSDLGTAPQTNWVNPRFTTSTGVDYAGLAIALSSDGGKTWRNDTGVGETTYGGNVAYSASGDTIVWSSNNQGVVRSQNGGSLAKITALPWFSLIASDKRDNNYFYACYNETIYISSDNGQNFAWGANVGGRINAVIVHPTIAGQVILGTNAGIYKSTNFGSSWQVLTSAVTNVTQITFGLGSGSTWYLYAFGAGYNGNRLYGSANNGTTWTDIQGTYQLQSGPLVGSGNVAGQVYIAAPSGGVIYANVEGALNCTVAGHNTPQTATIIPLSGCTTVAPSQTFTLTPACATAVGNLPISGANNSPAGPSNCTESCDMFRVLSQTCCGAGGSLGNPISIPPGVALPRPIQIPAGFVTNTPLDVPIQMPANASDPNDPNVRHIPAGQNITVPFWIPAGWAPVPAGAAPLVIPPLDFPASDPPSEPDTADPEKMCDPELTDSIGLCGNGNFPFYSPDSGIDCDLGSAIDTRFLTFCQSWSMDNPTEVTDYVDVVQECLTCPGYAGLALAKRRLAGLTAGNVTTEPTRIRARATTCPPAPTDTPGPSSPSGTPPCERTFVCDGSRWPNICGNAESAISVRGFSPVMTRVKSTSHLTKAWYRTKFGTDGKTTLGNKPAPGWGLIGCNVEEYPFASGRGSGDNNAAIRLVPQVENSDHAHEMSRFYREWEESLPSGEKTIGRTFCISFSNSQLTPSNDYGLDRSVAGNLNICAKPYGPEFLLVTGGMRVGQEDPTKDWDPWFNVDPTRLTTQTYASFGTTTKTRVGPPLYCKDPSPGLQEYVSGSWQLHPMGQPRSALPNGGPGGMSLGCAPIPQPLQKRRYGARERQERQEESIIAASKETKREVKKRSTAGSLLNVNVYQYLPMCSSNDDYDPCDAKPCNYYGDDGNLFPADCCPSPTPSPTTTTTTTTTNPPTPGTSTNPPVSTCTTVGC